MRLFYALAALVAVAALAVAAPASATPPLHTTFTAGGSEEPMNCGNGVVLTETFTFTADRTTFFNEEGQRVKLIERAYYEGVITNEATGTQFSDRNHYTRIVDLEAGTVTYNGVILQIHEVGGGPVLGLDVGHIVYSRATRDVLQMSAKRPLFGEYALGAWDYEAYFCSLLASR